jgi:hypothetical protein
MRPGPRSVTVRIDRDVIDVTGVRAGREQRERHPVASGTEAVEVLQHTLQTSGLLRPGRSCHLRVLLESDRTVYTTTGDDGSAVPLGGGLGVAVAADLIDRFERVIRQRRVLGPATLEVGPLARFAQKVSALPAPGRAARDRTLFIDRSAAAITVALFDQSRAIWIRGAPSDDPRRAVASLLHGAATDEPEHFPPDRWFLDDLTLLADHTESEQPARWFEEICTRLLDGQTPSVIAR